MRNLLRSLAPAVVLIAATAYGQIGQKDKTLIQAPEDKIPGKPYNALHALLIGINEYPHLPNHQLDHALDDADGLKQVLTQDYGFTDVQVLTDKQATLSAIRAALASFADSNRVHRDDLVFIYFSGHGQTVKTAAGGEMGFLIPSDAKVDLSDPSNSGPYLTTCLPMKQVWDYLELSPAKHAVVVADVCFSGLLTRSRGLGLSHDALSVLLSRRARQVMTAGSSGQETIERDDLGHGLFTAKLIDELRARAAAKDQPFTISQLFGELQTEVSDASHGKQTPQMGNFDTDGEVVFVPVGATGEVARPLPTQSNPKKESDKKSEKPARKDSSLKTEPTTTKSDSPTPAGDSNPNAAPPAGLSKRQADYYSRLRRLMDDAPNHFANLKLKNKNKVTRADGSIDMQLYPLADPLPGFTFGGVTDPSDVDSYLYFEGTPTGVEQVFKDYKAAIRALVPDGHEQQFDSTHWRISNRTVQVSIRCELPDTWHVEKVYQPMTLTILYQR